MWRADALGRRFMSPETVRVTWLGTAGFAIECLGHVVLIDPYITRAPLRSLWSGLCSDSAAIARHVPRADAVIVGHTHFDHVLDVPTIARQTGARVFGSRSAAALCRSCGIPDSQLDVVEAGRPVEREVGPFRLRFIPSAHSRLLLGRVPSPGDIQSCDDVPTRATGYRCGAVFGVEIQVAGRKLYHMGSAELLEQNVQPSSVDLLMLCVAGWTSTRNLPERALKHFSPGAILLSHWDNFLLPIDLPARALPAMQIPRLVGRLERAACGVRVGALPIFGEVWL